MIVLKGDKALLQDTKYKNIVLLINNIKRWWECILIMYDNELWIIYLCIKDNIWREEK